MVYNMIYMIGTIILYNIPKGGGAIRVTRAHIDLIHVRAKNG